MHAPHIRVELMDELHGFDALVCAAGHNSQVLHIRATALRPPWPVCSSCMS